MAGATSVVMNSLRVASLVVMFVSKRKRGACKWSWYEHRGETRLTLGVITKQT